MLDVFELNELIDVLAHTLNHSYIGFYCEMFLFLVIISHFIQYLHNICNAMSCLEITANSPNVSRIFLESSANTNELVRSVPNINSAHSNPRVAT